MHIIAGRLRGRRLHFLRTRELRPVSQKVRAAVFNILQSRIEGLRVLDLFCGTGSVGLEALSRGASHADFVDLDVSLVVRNVRDLGVTEVSEVYRKDVHKAVDIIREKGKTYGFVFVGAPYPYPDTPRLLAALGEGGVVEPGGYLVYEHSNRTTPPQALGSLSRKKTYPYGQTVLTLYVRGD